MILIKIPQQHCVTGGAFNQLLLDMGITNKDALSIHTNGTTGNVEIGNIDPTSPITQSVITTTLVKQVVTLGGEVEDMPVFFKMLESYANTNPVPSYFPNSTDENGDPVLWKDWRDSTHLPVIETDTNGDTWYIIGSNAYGYNLLASVWSKLVGDPDVTVLTIKDYQDFMAQFQDPNTP